MMAVSGSQSSRNIASKLHRQFGHPTSEKLIKLVKKAGINDKQLEKEINFISQQCIYCLQYRRAPPRPVVSMPLANKFNETVSMDLKMWCNSIFLVMVDTATRFCTATVVSNKSPSTIIKGFFVSWITLFGAPMKILTDNGGEFNNDEMKALGESFNIKILSTAAESPWSNGICERLNGVLGTMVSKIVEDAKCDVHTALAWAVSARNAFDNNSGFSPNQLLFGFNPSMPNVFNNKLPALENVTSSEMVRKNLNAKEVARQAFMKCESDERIRRALRNNIRNTEINDLRNGDDVYYKRNDSQKWRGPGQVIGRDGKQILVKHGGSFVRVHSVRLTKMPGERVSDFTQSQAEVSTSGSRSTGLQTGKEVVEDTGPQTGRRVHEGTGLQVGRVVSNDGTGFQTGREVHEDTGLMEEVSNSNFEGTGLQHGRGVSNTGFRTGKRVSEDTGLQTGSGVHDGTDLQVGRVVSNEGTDFRTGKVVFEDTGLQTGRGVHGSTGLHLGREVHDTGLTEEVSNNIPSSSGLRFGRVEPESMYLEGNGIESTEGISRDRNHDGRYEELVSNTAKMSGVWKGGQRFQGIDSTTGEHISGKINNRAGKVKGTNKDCYNIIRDNDGWQGWLDFRNLRDLSPVNDETEMIILFNNDAVAVAKETEIKTWKDNQVYEEVLDVGQKIISVRWVITEKFKNQQLVTRARLVARGFEEATNNLRKDSPTCSKESIRILVIVASSHGWDCHTVDVKSAYLQGDAIDRDIYLKPPSEFSNGNLWKLKKTVYGLCDAARAWYKRVKTELNNLSVQMCTLDNSLFIWKRNGKLEGLICIYVDDFLWTGSISFYNCVIQKLKTKFLIGSAASKSFTYIGLQIRSYDNGITVDQIQYASSLTPISISQDRALQKTSQLIDSEKRSYRALVGQLNWIATHTRPDIAFDTCELSVSFPNATMADLLKLNKLVDRVKREPLSLFFPRLQFLSDSTLECYTDAAFANLPNAGSQGAFIVFMTDEKGKRCPIFWQTRKLKRVVKSTLAAETMALLEGAEASIYILGILKQLLSKNTIKMQCMTDNKSLYEALLSSKQVEDKRLRIDISVLDDLLGRSEIEKVLWVSGANQLADALTKKGVATEKLRAALCRYGH